MGEQVSPSKIPWRAVILSGGLFVLNIAFQLSQAKGWASSVPDDVVLALWIIPIVPLGWWLFSHERLKGARRKIAFSFSAKPLKTVSVAILMILIVVASCLGLGWKYKKLHPIPIQAVTNPPKIDGGADQHPPSLAPANPVPAQVQKPVPNTSLPKLKFIQVPLDAGVALNPGQIAIGLNRPGVRATITVKQPFDDPAFNIQCSVPCIYSTGVVPDVGFRLAPFTSSLVNNVKVHVEMPAALKINQQVILEFRSKDDRKLSLEWVRAYVGPFPTLTGMAFPEHLIRRLPPTAPAPVPYPSEPRPYLFMDTVSIDPDELNFRIIFRNSGTVPAVEVTTQVQVMLVSEQPSWDLFAPVLAAPASSGNVPAGSSILSPVVTGKSFNPDSFAEVKKGTYRLYVYGQATYKDLKGNSYQPRFCVQWQPAQSMFPFPTCPKNKFVTEQKP